jgi:hypothetical protein
MAQPGSRCGKLRELNKYGEIKQYYFLQYQEGINEVIGRLFGEKQAARKNGKIKSILILADKNPSEPEASWGPRNGSLIRKILSIVDAGSVKAKKVLLYHYPDCRPTDDTTVLRMRLLTICPLNGFPMDLEHVKYFPFRLEEANGVAAVEFEQE